MIRIRAMTDEEREAFLPLLNESYAQDVAASACMSIAEARAEAEAEFTMLLKREKSTERHSLDIVLDEETSEPLGSVWWRVDDQKKRGFLFNVHVLEQHRGKGIGHEIMKLMDETLRKKGATHVILNVSARNCVAQALYEKNGYTSTNIFMTKRL